MGTVHKRHMHKAALLHTAPHLTLETHPALQGPEQLLAEDPPDPNWPARHCVEQGAARPTTALYRPGAQGVQAPCPDNEYVPTGHRAELAFTEPAGQNQPAVQAPVQLALVSPVPAKEGSTHQR